MSLTRLYPAFLQHGHECLGHADGSVFVGTVLGYFLFRAHLREEENLLNRGLARHEHDQTVDADTDAASGGACHIARHAGNPDR